MIGKLFHFIFVLFILALLIGVPAGWMITRSYSNPEVHYFYAQKAPEEGTDQEKGEEALRFIVLSDLYNHVFEGGNGEIADQAANTSPDAILICGNMISADAENTDVITSLIKRLVQIAPVYYTYGEQEMKYVKAHTVNTEAGTEESADPLREALEKEGAVVLNEEFEDITIYGVSTRIGGMYNKAYEMTNLRGDVKKGSETTWKFLKKFQKTNRFKVMLCSKPESFIYGNALKDWRVDLVVSGNDLGGLVVLPYYGGVFGGSQGYFPEYIHGMYEKDNVDLFITSGLSAPKNMIPRFNNPPEIAVLDISDLESAETLKARIKAKEADKEAAEEEKAAAEKEQKEKAEEQKNAGSEENGQ